MITLKINIGGKETEIKGLLAYNVEKTLFKDSDVFSAVTDNPGGMYSDMAKPGKASIYDNGRLVFTGWVDGIHNVGAVDIKQIGWAGRDLMGPVVDSDADPKTYTNIKLEAFLRKRLAPFGFSVFNVEATKPKKRIIVQIHESEWDACLRVAREFGKHLWVDADGTVMAQTVGYAKAPEYTFKRVKDGDTAGGTVIPIKRGEQGFKFEKLLTEVHVRYGQHASQVTAENYAEMIKEGLLRRQWKDLVEIKDKPAARKRAQQMLEESKVGSRDIIYEIEEKYGRALKLNTVATVDDWYLKVDGDFLIAGLSWRKGVDPGTVIEVTLRPKDDAVKVLPKLVKETQKKKKRKSTADKIKELQG